MARLSDIIEDFIKEMLQNAVESELQIQRNELATHFSCAPSQINYVLTTRFTVEKGYYIESKRGGGGCIVIRKIECQSNKPLVDAINEKIGESITYDGAVQLIDGLLEAGIITEREAIIIKVAVNDRILGLVENRNKLRAEIIKSIFMVIIV